MMIGYQHGSMQHNNANHKRRRRPCNSVLKQKSCFRFGIDTFLDEEGGYTTISVACALLVSLALLFGLAQGIWMQSKSSSVQTVADAAALSASQVTKSFTTTAQVVDATVLSLGLTGTFVTAAGLITAFVPGLGGVGVKIADVGKDILSARQDFARSSAQGLATLEKTLPFLQAENAFAITQLNSSHTTRYVGAAIPFPAVGKCDYGLADDLQADELSDTVRKAAELSDKTKHEKEALDKSLEQAWRADNIDDPMCCYSRAKTLAHLSDIQNPHYPVPDGWTFGVALERARAYYGARLSQERPASSSVEDEVESAARKVFYQYALEQVHNATYHEDGSVCVIDFPYLPQNSAMTKETHMYTDAIWPTTNENGRRTIHAYAGCPGARGESRGLASLARLGAGTVVECPVCKFTLATLGKVAGASTSIDNGYEHYWKIIVDASKQYEKAKKNYNKAQEDLKQSADKDVSLFERALALLAVPRPQIFPPGAYGCIAIVRRLEGVETPSELNTHFSAQATLPGGFAIAGATLAPDNAHADDTVLSHFFDWMCDGSQEGIPGVIDGIMTLWGNFLLSYGSAAENMSKVTDDFFGTLDAVSGSTLGAWISHKLTSLVAAAGFEPADLRLRKPVLCNTEDIIQADGSLTTERLRNTLQQIPKDPSIEDIAQAFGRTLVDEIKDQDFCIATLTLPGTSLSVPLTINLSSFASES